VWQNFLKRRKGSFNIIAVFWAPQAIAVCAASEKTVFARAQEQLLCLKTNFEVELYICAD